MSDIYKIKNIPKGFSLSQCEINDIPDPQKDNWIFGGWIYNGTTMTEEEVLTVKNDVNKYYVASWNSPDNPPYEVVINFNPNGVCPAESHIIINDTEIYTNNSPYTVMTDNNGYLNFNYQVFGLPNYMGFLEWENLELIAEKNAGSYYYKQNGGITAKYKIYESDCFFSPFSPANHSLLRDSGNVDDYGGVIYEWNGVKLNENGEEEGGEIILDLYYNKPNYPILDSANGVVTYYWINISDLHYMSSYDELFSNFEGVERFKSVTLIIDRPSYGFGKFISDDQSNLFANGEWGRGFGSVIEYLFPLKEEGDFEESSLGEDYAKINILLIPQTQEQHVLRIKDFHFYNVQYQGDFLEDFVNSKILIQSPFDEYDYFNVTYLENGGSNLINVDITVNDYQSNFVTSIRVVRNGDEATETDIYRENDSDEIPHWLLINGGLDSN